MKQPAAYCLLHRKKLTVNQIKEHKCTDPKKQRKKGQCNHLVKYLDHPHWVSKAINKEFRRTALI